jgi:hypothetical protein
MRHTFIAIALTALAFIPSAQAQQTDWYNLNPETSACVKADFTPRQFYIGLRDRGEWSELRVNRSDIDNTITGVAVRYLMEGIDMTLTFYPSLKQCNSGLDEAIRSGRVLPPDTDPSIQNQRTHKHT